MQWMIWAAIGALTAIVIGLTGDIMGIFSTKNHFPVEGRTVLITGGSQGMGRGVAKLIAQKGANVVLVARDVSKLKNAIVYITAAAKNPSKQRFHWISADVSKSEENTRLLEEVVTWNHGQPPDIIWAIAGSSNPTLFIDTPLETLRSQMDMNYFSTVYLAHASLKVFLKPSTSVDVAKATSALRLPRHFIMTSSSVAFVGIGGYSPYAPAKAALRSLADCLRSEMNLYHGARRRDPASSPITDVKISCIFPGTILTPGFEHEETMKPGIAKILEEDDPQQTADEVAAAAVRGLERGHSMITTNWLGSLMRISALGGSPRDSWFLDTVGSWVTSLAWLFIGPDMEAKVFNFGKKHGAVANQT